MRTYCLRDLTDSTLRHDLHQLVSTDRSTTAHLVAHLAEFIARKLYREDGYASMYEYCVGELGMSEDVACRRIRAARAARRFPLIFEALADGRIHLAGIALLAPRLTEDNAEELLGSAFHKSKRTIELLIAERFPLPDLPTLMASLGAAPVTPATVPSLQVGQGLCAAATVPANVATPLSAPGRIDVPTEAAPQPVSSSVPAQVDVPAEAAAQPAHSAAPARIDGPAARVTPLAPGRFGWQLTVGQETQDLAQDVQDLLGHDVAPGDLEAVLKFALQTAKQTLERRKFAATERPRAGHRNSNADSRHIPAEVRRAVWRRDGGQCTFTSDTGHRCEERKDLQFDHIDPYARGGKASISGMRLLCWAHNQLEAERTYGAEFMRHKREEARHRTSRKRA